MLVGSPTKIKKAQQVFYRLSDTLGTALDAGTSELRGMVFYFLGGAQSLARRQTCKLIITRLCNKCFVVV